MNEEILNQLGTAGNTPVTEPTPKEEPELKVEKPKKKSNTDIDQETIEQMLLTGDNENGMFIPDKETKDEFGNKIEEEKPDESMKISKVKQGKVSDKYKTAFKEDMAKHPEKYKINTPRGEMTVKEAIQKGYDPITKSFKGKQKLEEAMEKELSKVNDKDREGIRNLLNPDNLHLKEADAAGLGVTKPGMIQKADNPLAGPAPEPNSLGVGASQPIPGSGEMPMAMPSSPAAGAQGQADIASLLGGAM
jgi:hypothetical protein